MSGSEDRDFRQILVEDTYVVWLSGANRFLQLKEPAFFVFEAWANCKEHTKIAGECAARYELPVEKAMRFTIEITGEIEKLYLLHRKGARPNIPFRDGQAKAQRKPGGSPVSQFTCSLYGKNILFIFGNTELEDTFRKLFQQFESKEWGMPEDGTIELSLEHDCYCLKVNEQEEQRFPEHDPEHFQGAVLMEILNILYGKSRDEWMGVFHASAVSDGNEALLFVAPSGSGKSTLAALLIAHGYQLLSDDFVPASLESPELYPLPAAISVKKNAIPFLKKYYSSLPDEHGAKEDINWEIFLPLPEGSFTSSPMKTKAIVFVQYDPGVEFHLVRESNLTAMNTLLKQSWIANTPIVAERFLNWYFGLPVYTLTYSDGEKMVREIKLIFDDVNDS